MADSFWETVGAIAVGGAVSIATTWVSEMIRDHRAHRLDNIRKDVLRRLLNGEKFTWRSMEMLSSAIGADEETTARLLLEIGARRSLAGRPHWGMKDWPDEQTSN